MERPTKDTASISAKAREYGLSNEMMKIVENMSINPDNSEVLYQKMMGYVPFSSDLKVGDYDGAAFAVQLQYQGFNPQVIAEMIISRVGTDASKANDVYKMIQIGLERGNNIENILKTSTPEFGASLKALRTTYCLKSKAGNSRYAITLSRVCMVFPMVSCHYMQYCKNTTVSKQLLFEISPDYPPFMMTGAFASMIPTGYNFTKHLKNAFMIHQYEFNAIINRKKYNLMKKKPTKKEIIAELTKYMEAGVNGTLIKLEDKLSNLVAWNILKPNKKATTKGDAYRLSIAVHRASQVWTETYGVAPKSKGEGPIREEDDHDGEEDEEEQEYDDVGTF